MSLAQEASARAFAEVAHGFCEWCEGQSLGAKPEEAAAFWLCRLYAAALLLPKVEPENSEDSPDPSQAETARARDNLGGPGKVRSASSMRRPW